MNSFPRRFGRATGTNVESLERSYLEDHGSAYNTDSLETYLSCESVMVSRALEYFFRQTKQYTNQNLPSRMTVHLEAWENIFGLHPARTDSEHDRREAIRLRIHYLNQPCTLQNIRDFATDVMGDCFQDVRVYTYTAGDFSGSEFIDVDGGLDLSSLGGLDLAEGLGLTSGGRARIRIIIDRTLQESNLDRLNREKKLSLLDDWLPVWLTWFTGSTRPFRLDVPQNLDGDYLAS